MARVERSPGRSDEGRETAQVQSRRPLQQTLFPNTATVIVLAPYALPELGHCPSNRETYFSPLESEQARTVPPAARGRKDAV